MSIQKDSRPVFAATIWLLSATIATPLLPDAPSAAELPPRLVAQDPPAATFTSRSDLVVLHVVAKSTCTTFLLLASANRTMYLPARVTFKAFLAAFTREDGNGGTRQCDTAAASGNSPVFGRPYVQWSAGAVRQGE